jgi:cupin fold WbuC family metalloprotein
MPDKFFMRSAEVFVPVDDMVAVDRADVAFFKGEAAKTVRRRTRLCAHADVEDAVHEMLIVHERDAYVRPHRHFGKSESFHVVEGQGTVLLFDEVGNVELAVELGDYASGRTFYFRIADARYHCLVITSPVMVFHECTKGPFRREETQFAPWSPPEEDVLGVRDFLRSLGEAF